MSMVMVQLTWSASAFIILGCTLVCVSTVRYECQARANPGDGDGSASAHVATGVIAVFDVELTAVPGKATDLVASQLQHDGQPVDEIVVRGRCRPAEACRRLWARL